jgi:hypothetical protein
MQRLEHGMLLDAKRVMDDAWGELEKIKRLVPEALHDELANLLQSFEDELAQCDVSDRYEEKSRGR